jgi:hypothetical protein
MKSAREREAVFERDFAIALEELDKLARQLDSNFAEWDKPGYRPQEWHVRQFTDGADRGMLRAAAYSCIL